MRLGRNIFTVKSVCVRLYTISGCQGGKAAASSVCLSLFLFRGCRCPQPWNNDGVPLLVGKTDAHAHPFDHIGALLGSHTTTHPHWRLPAPTRPPTFEVTLFLFSHGRPHPQQRLPAPTLVPTPTAPPSSPSYGSGAAGALHYRDPLHAGTPSALTNQRRNPCLLEDVTSDPPE